MKQIVPTNRRGVTARPAPFSVTNVTRRVAQGVQRDQFGNIVLRTLGGTR